MRKLLWYRETMRALGPINLARLQIGQLTARFGLNLRVGGPHLLNRVSVRPGTSDKMVFHQIFVDREYRCLDGLGALDTILDCGANVGYSTAYFLSRFPACRVVAIEPDPTNFQQLARNLAPFGVERTKLIKGAVWDRRTHVNFDPATLGESNEWGRQVNAEGNGNVDAYDIPTIIRESGFEKISLLKMDVEGAERIIFSGDTSAWLSLIENIVIELHGAEAERIFHAAIAPFGFEISRCDELTVCLGRVDKGDSQQG